MNTFVMKVQIFLSVILLLWTKQNVLASIDSPGFGYEVSTDVSQYLNLALDIRDMIDAGNNVEVQRAVYLNGRNALPLTLASLSLDAPELYSQDPLFNLYLDLFLQLGQQQQKGDQVGFFDGAPAGTYANSLVSDLFYLNEGQIPAQGALVLNVVMAIWGSLYQMLRACERNDEGTQRDMFIALDQAAALWVGAGQIKGENQAGNMLYHLAEVAGALFGQDQGESLLNTLLLESFDFLQQDVINNRCATGVDAYVVVREKVKILISFMNAFMVQMLLHSVETAVTAGSDFATLYALALLPQISACDEKLYATLVELAVDQDVTLDTKDTIIKAIQASYSCLGITCDDVGTYKGGQIPKCDDSLAADIPYLAEYQPLTDVRRKSHIDRDIWQIGIFTRLNAMNAARDYYLYGWNTFFSLSELAQNTFSPETSPEFNLFQEYYNTLNFAEDTILNAMDLEPPFENASIEQRAAIVVGTLQTVVMYLSMLAELDSAIAACEGTANSESTSLERWDGGAAFYIGSSEGQLPGGQNGGQLFYELAKQFCGDFGTCTSGDANVNTVIQAALADGRDALADGRCDLGQILLDTTIRPSLLVPLIQGTLFYAAQSVNLPAGTDSGELGSLHAFSRAVLPTISRSTVEGASLVDSNSEFQLITKPVLDGLNSMFGAFRLALQTIETDCRDIGLLATGTNAENGVCATNTPSERPTNEPSSTPIMIPTKSPTLPPTHLPSLSPTDPPTETPSDPPSREPSSNPTKAPTSRPTSESPSEIPSSRPSSSPTSSPTQSPSAAPTQRLSESPSNQPSSSQSPTLFPTTLPSSGPSWIPSGVPTFIPSLSPTLAPSTLPSGNPTSIPTVSLQPTALPSTFPTSIPTVSLQPTALPSIFPTSVPSSVPTSVPSMSTLSPTTSAPTRNSVTVGTTPTTTATSGGGVHSSRATSSTMLLIWSTFLTTVIWVG